jgi:hypothetical protein
VREPLFPSVVTTTADEPTSGMLLRISINKDQGWMVTDMVGLRYGFATDLASAVKMWADDVEAILEIPAAELGAPLAHEVRSYRKALGL